MNKFVSFLIVLLAIAVATPVLAEQRLSLNGEMRVRGWHIDVDGKDQTNTFADQRLRIGGKMSVAEGVSVNFRMDATESTWGSQPALGSGRLVNPNNTMQWDRAHMDIEKGMFHLRAGQQWVGFGKSGFDAQDNGLLLNIKGPVAVSMFYMLDKDNNTAEVKATPTPIIAYDTDADGDLVLDADDKPVPIFETFISSPAVEAKNGSDAHYFGLNVGHKTDVYTANVFAAGQKNGDEEVYVLGVTYAQNIDVLKLYTELEYFFGDATSTKDAYGLQAFVDVSAAVTETVTVGGQLFYAMGDDEDTQYTLIGNGFSGWDPVFSLGTGLDNEVIKYGGGNPYAALGKGAGLLGGRIYASMKATDALTFSGSAFYGVDDEDKVSTYKDVMALGAGMSYAVMANTKLGVQVQYSEYSDNANTGLATDEDLEKFEVGTGLFVSF